MHVQDEHKMRVLSCFGQRPKLPYVTVRGIKKGNKGKKYRARVSQCHIFERCLISPHQEPVIVEAFKEPAVL